MAWSVDRLGRSLQDLVAFLGELHAVGVDLFLHQQGIDTTTPAGKAMFQMMGVFAEFERAMIQDRVKAGLARARAQGKTLGRPKVPADQAGEFSLRGPVAISARPHYRGHTDALSVLPYQASQANHLRLPSPVRPACR